MMMMRADTAVPAFIPSRSLHRRTSTMLELLTDPQAWIALATLLALEIVLGVDNVVFISILAGKLPASQQRRARTVGLALALVTRILLLLSLSGIIKLTAPLFA